MRVIWTMNNWDIKTNQNETSLTHYGVKGMKWGVRKEYVPHPRKIKPKAGSVSNVSAKNKLANLSKARKIALGVSGVVLGASLGYMTYQKIGQDYVGGILEAGTTLHTIMTSENLDYGRKFYASFIKSDVKLYRKALPSQRSIQTMYDKTFSKEIAKSVLPTYDVQSVVSSSVKYPSNKTAENIYKQLRKESSVFSANTDENYENFNAMLSGTDTPIAKMYYEKLKQLGYSAIIDTNDQKGTGFQSQKPLIVFDTSGITKGAVEKLSELDGKTAKEIEKIGEDALNAAAMKKLAPQVATMIGGYSLAISVSPNAKGSTTNNKNRGAKLKKV